jgi:hypothetical protein
LKGVLSGDLLLEDDSADLFDQCGIFENEKMSIEDTGVLRSKSFGDLPLHLEDFVAGIDKRLLEPVDLMGELSLRNVLFWNEVVLRTAQDKDLPARHTGGNRYAAKESLT